MAHFRVVWRRQRKGQRLPELNSYPATPQAYYEGYYPGSAAVKANRSEFSIEFQKIPELNTYPSAPAANQYPAFNEQGKHKVSFERTFQETPKLNTFPETPVSNQYPAFIGIGKHRVEFKRVIQVLPALDEYAAPPTPNYGEYPAFVLEAANKSSFIQTRQELPELNIYPATPVGYYSGFYPGSALAKANRVWFRRNRLDVELNEYPETVDFVPSVPGLEYTLPNNRLHYDIQNNKLHYDILDNKLHYTIEGNGVGTAPQRQPASVGAERNAAFSFVKDLDEGELLTGTPLVEEDTTTDLTITNKSVSTQILIINGESVPIGMAVQCHITGFVSDNFPYYLNISVGTDSAPAQILPGTIIIEESC